MNPAARATHPRPALRTPSNPAATKPAATNPAASTPRTVRIVRAVIAPLTRTPAFRSAAPVLLPVAERVTAAVTGGRAQLSALLVPSLVLHTRGARTGAHRTVHLMYTPDGRGRAIVAGTSFARERHPAWTANLAVHPEGAIDVRGRILAVRAEPILGAEREAAWHRIESQWPGYRGYERRSGRTVRLYLLRPVAGPPPAWFADPPAGAGEAARPVLQTSRR